ncbi:PREDICTED: PDZ domain-containing protein 9 [Tinamus guttatus]|uniref:PDZ domain-containing protein 9 n=1 Tax=Tinamus guttatus TaxID=94827 RepID=UPI00052F1EF8|nr:PREDICTED: PDZ domain-containing protein 9 [Tinamus guttatus]
MGEQGLGLIVIQNGSYLQITNLVEEGSAAQNGKLKPGDILIKIGHANVLGWTLRELRQLLHNIPVGTNLQIRVCRDFVELPQHWQRVADLIPEAKLPTTADTSGEDTEDKDDTETSSDDNDDADFKTFQCKSVQTSCYDFTRKLSSLSRTCHASNTSHTLTVGKDTGCDIVLHNDSDTSDNSEFNTVDIRSISKWIMEENETSSSSSCSSVSDAFWMEEFGFP